jgi:serine protease Do
MKRGVVVIAIIILIIAGIQNIEFVKKTAIYTTFFKNLNFPSLPKKSILEEQNVVFEESVVTQVVERSLPSVVTIGISSDSLPDENFRINPFDPFDTFQEENSDEEQTSQNIGSGFIISKDGLIITNKHVVLDTEVEYKVLTNDQKEYDVEKIYRDPLNDLAILKINASNLRPLPLGDSTKLKLGQLAIAIGTPLGEFQNTVTVGIISGLGRGITAGSPFEGFVEKLDNVIQTDAAISAGNSGGPLLNSSGHAVAVNTAIASQGQNIGFAIPINVVKDLIVTFERQGGNFERPYIGIRYQMVDRRTAILNDVVEGAYVESVIEDSPAETAGIREDDIITHIDGKKLSGEDNEVLAKIIQDKKIGDSIEVEIWRNDEVLTVDMVLEGTAN